MGVGGLVIPNMHCLSERATIESTFPDLYLLHPAQIPSVCILWGQLLYKIRILERKFKMLLTYGEDGWVVVWASSLKTLTCIILS